jgi:hypothetical protein
MVSDGTPLDRACLLVGRFFHDFGGIEVQLNEALRKLFELSPNSAETICSTITFFNKMDIVKSALIDQDKARKKTHAIKTLFGAIARINDQRKIAAHATFEANEAGGVLFKRSSAKAGLRRETLVWTEADCTELFLSIEKLRTKLHFMVQSIAPYRPSLDFSDPRNSMYLSLL